MFSYILFPTDFSELSAQAFNYVKKLKEAGARKVHLLYVLDIVQISFIGTIDTFSSLRVDSIEKEVKRELEDKAQKGLSEMKLELEAAGFEADYEISEGIPYEKILEIAGREKVDIIVIASHGKSPLKEMFLGSTSEKVIRFAKCPVLVVKTNREV
ncbi:MAG: universal stress protein [bacterium]